MNSVDKKYIKNFMEIYGMGNSNEGEEVRTKWHDGTPAYTKSVFCQINRYDLSEGFPILGLRKMGWKTAIKEILWIWAQRSNNINDLGAHIWDDWADETGSIGKCYGWEMDRVIDFPDTPEPMNQVNRLIYLLRNKPNDRRMITNTLNFDNMKEMGLVPCAFMTIWKVTGNKLNLTLVQRSGDFLSASGCGGFNPIQYSALLMMIAKITGYEAGELVHIVNDSHIYDRHIDIIDKMITEANIDGYMDDEEPLPKLIIHGDQKELEDFKIEDFELVGYNPRKGIGKFEVAV